jgi:hypothetical protein
MNPSPSPSPSPSPYRASTLTLTLALTLSLALPRRELTREPVVLHWKGSSGVGPRDILLKGS